MGEMDVPLRIVTGDEASRSGATSFEDLVEAANVRLFRALYLMTGNRHEAEEVMQDAFLALWERWDRVAEMDDPTGYLFRTALNIWRKRLRRASLAARKALSLAPDDDPFATVDEREAVFVALRSLRPKERAAIGSCAPGGSGRSSSPRA